MKNRAIVPAFVAVSLTCAVCVSNVPAVELLSRMTSKIGKAEAKCGASVQKSAKQKGNSAKKSHRNVLSNLVSQIQKSVAPKSAGKAKSSPKQKSAAQKSAKQKSAKQKSAKQKSAKQKGNHTPLKDLLSHITSAVQPKQKSAKQKSAAQKSAKQKSAAQKSAKQKSAAQKSAKSGGHVRNLLGRVVRHMEPKCGAEPQGKKASAGKQDDATPPPAPEVSNEA
ncbi:MAG: hypothetical protein CMJ75_02585 [Planctomycetaceae bacterium]|nr:hypothetical protein [Planctomycetaceae bacterium]